MIGRSPSLGQSGPWRLYGPSFSNHLRNCVIGNVRHHNSVVTPMVTACVDGRQCPLGLVCSILAAHGVHSTMWNSAWNELREVVYVAVMVGGLSAVGVGLAVALVLAGVA
jgi:hypothetical protein